LETGEGPLSDDDDAGSRAGDQHRGFCGVEVGVEDREWIASEIDRLSADDDCEPLSAVRLAYFDEFTFP
jgi:hypothetical protein